MANSLRRDRWAVNIVTPRWHASWPVRVTVEDAEVHRLGQAPSNPLHQSLFRRSLGEWLDHHAHQLSWIWCDEAGLDSLAVCSHSYVIRQQIPVIVRFCPVELSATLESDSPWQPSQAVLDACSSATTVVVPTQSAQQHLLKHGLPPQKIVVCSDWNIPAIDRTPASIRAARQALAEINGDLAVRSQDRVVVVPGELAQRWQLDFLIQALVPLLDRYPNFRLWLHGDGPDRERLYESLQLHGHHRNVVMPGMFSCFESLLQAADMCLFPAAGVGMSWLIPTCLVSGLAVLVANSPDLTWLLGSAASSISFEPRSKDHLSSRIEQWMRNPEQLVASTRLAGQLIRRQASNAIPRGGLAELFRVPTSIRSVAHSMQPQR